MVLRKAWAGWIYAWNAFDRWVDWYFIGETWKLYAPSPETQTVEIEWSTLQLERQKSVDLTVAPLVVTPVTRNLKDLAVEKGVGEVRSKIIRLNLLASGSVPKDLQYPESNEDSFAWNESAQRAAVFDGATESFAARRWVELIRQEWLIGDPMWIRNAQVTYSQDIQELNLSWAQLEAAERGSYTTLASIEVVSNALQITTVGDSCVFLIEGTRITGAAPYVSSEEFFASPQAISTRTQDDIDTALNTNTFTLSAESLTGKQLLLATDALSQWLMIMHPQERVSKLLHALNTDELSGLVAKERSTGAMKTDDTTALLLKVSVGEPE